MIFEHNRFEIWNIGQHPYKHSLAEFAYSNPALPGVTNVNAAVNWILAVLYPQTKPSVATPAALPLTGNLINDYRVVQNDGDGKAASYRWEQREGETTPSWHKVFDMDWGSDSILAAFQSRTQDLYVFRRGYDELDNAGLAIAGLYAGQVVTGGLAANSNLTLRANAGDGVGPRTGFVQVDDQFRPTVDNLFDIGTSTFKFKTIYLSTSALVSTMTLSSGSILDTTGAITFGLSNLTTTGNISGAIITGSASLKTGTMTITGGNIADTTGALSFNSLNLTTLGTITAAIGSKLADIAFANGSITSLSATITFGANNLLTTGTLGAGVTTVTQLSAANLRLAGNTLSALNLNGNLILSANGTGIIDLQNPVTSLGITATGVVSVTGQLNIDNLRLDGNVISSTNLNGNITLTPNGTGVIETSASIIPTVSNTFSLGSTPFNFKDLFLAGVISNGTNSISTATLLTLRSISFRNSAETLPVQNGDALFYDSVSGKWLANHPDTEILHSEISGLVTGDAGHTQFAMLAGRSGGQTLQGGTLASNNLVLESTSNVTKGNVITKDTFLPFTAPSFSGTWSGLDLGSATFGFRDLYTRGELKGARLENFTEALLPASSGQNIGRVVWATDTKKAYVDTGAVFQVLGVAKFSSDLVFNGTDLTKDTTVSATIVDARKAIWQLRDNANDFEIIFVKITTPSATVVRITTTTALPAGSYRLIGLE